MVKDHPQGACTGPG